MCVGTAPNLVTAVGPCTCESILDVASLLVFSLKKRLRSSSTCRHALLDIGLVLAVGVPHRALLTSHQKVQDKRSHGPHSSHSLHNCRHCCTRNCRSTPWRDSIDAHTSSRVPSHDGFPPVSMGSDSLHWVTVHRLCHLH